MVPSQPACSLSNVKQQAFSRIAVCILLGPASPSFACEHFDLEPDILCLGKAITDGFAGMGATVITPRVARKVQDELSFWSTYGWHPFAVDAAIANLRYIKRHRGPLLRNFERMSSYFQTRLSAMPFEQPAQIGLKGLAIAVQLGSERYASGIGDACQEAGLVINAVDNYLAIFPAHDR